MALRFWDPELEEVVIQQDDGSFTFEDGEEAPVSHGDTLIAPGGEEMEVDFGDDDDDAGIGGGLDEEALEERVDESYRAAADIENFLHEQRWREDEALEEQEAAQEEQSRYRAIDEREAREQGKRAFRQQLREVERVSGHSFTQDEKRNLLPRFLGGLERDPDYIIDHAIDATWPDGMDEQSTADVVADEQAKENDGLVTRATARAQVGATGEAQNYSITTVEQHPDDSSLDLVRVDEDN